MRSVIVTTKEIFVAQDNVPVENVNRYIYTRKKHEIDLFISSWWLEV